MATHRKIKLKQQLRKLHSHQFLLSIASFGLVLPLHSLPELRQHQIMMIIIGIYAVVNLSYGMRRKNSLSPVYHLFESWCLYTVVMLFVSTNQGMRGDFFPLLYVTILIIGFTLPEKMSLTIASCMFLTLFAWDKPLLPYLPVQEKMLYLLKFFSLMVFSPFIILLAHHYEKASSRSDQLMITKQLLKTFQEEDEILVKHVPAGICIIDHEGRVQEFSPAAEHLTGISAPVIIGSVFSDFCVLVPESASDTSLDLPVLLQRGKSLQDLPCALTAGPNRLPVQLTVIPMKGAADHVIGATIVFVHARVAELHEKLKAESHV